MSYEFCIPNNTILGKDAIKNSKDTMVKFGRKALIVTGKHVTKSGIVKTLTDYLDEWDIQYYIFNDITGEPTDKMIYEGVESYDSNECDFVIGIGGGSPLDSAKAIAAFSTLDGEMNSYMGKEITGDFPALVLIPTTAGTGSEATKFTIITDTKNDVKMLLLGRKLIGDLAIIDHTLTVTAPKSVTAATGMDALTHAVEAYTSKKANSMTDLFALSAIKRIFKYLPLAYEDGNNLKAREEMAIAAYEAGICINNSSVTLVHGMSRPIGALFHVAHGISNAMLIKEGLLYVLDGSYDRFADITRAINPNIEYEDNKSAALAFIAELDNLCKKVEIPTLEEYGIDKEEFYGRIDKMSQDAISSGSPGNTVKSLDKEDIAKIYKKLW